MEQIKSLAEYVATAPLSAEQIIDLVRAAPESVDVEVEGYTPKNIDVLIRFSSSVATRLRIPKGYADDILPIGTA